MFLLRIAQFSKLIVMSCPVLDRVTLLFDELIFLDQLLGLGHLQPRVAQHYYEEHEGRSI